MKRILFFVALMAIAIGMLKYKVLYDPYIQFNSIEWKAIITPNSLMYSLFASFLFCLVFVLFEYEIVNQTMEKAEKNKDVGTLHHLKGVYSDIVSPLCIFWRYEPYYWASFCCIIVLSLQGTFNWYFIATYCIGAFIYATILYFIRTVLLVRLNKRYRNS